MSVATGDRFAEKDRETRIWEILDVRAMNGRPHARLHRLDDPTRIITLAVSVLEDRRFFKRSSRPPAHAA
ncbi:MAG: hypothetical protein GC191_02755 [Azospirillum sp.]|nr:hypothetical protein [Azospirillum sp.]